MQKNLSDKYGAELIKDKLSFLLEMFADSERLEMAMNDVNIVIHGKIKAGSSTRIQSNGMLKQT